MTVTLVDPDFVTGLVAGAGSAVALWAAGRLWVQGVVPCVRRWLYRGVNISGEWQGLGTGYTPAHGEWSELVLRLHQDIRAVRGVVTLRSRSANHSFDVDLQVAGTLTDEYLALNLLPRNESVTSPATALLKLEHGGRSLNGQLLFRHPFLDIVDLIDISVHRTQPAVSPQARTATIAAAPSFADTNPMPSGTVLE
jgi:hypothetical protein